jgi:hypothetical protein
MFFLLDLIKIACIKNESTNYYVLNGWFFNYTISIKIKKANQYRFFRIPVKIPQLKNQVFSVREYLREFL